MTVIPDSQDNWAGWVSASRTRNFVLDDPLLDWLDLYGKANGFARDTDISGYDPLLDFSRFVMDKGNQFEEAFMRWLSDKTDVVTIGDFRVARSLEAAEETVSAMEQGTAVIAQAPLRNPENRTYGQPDLLMRLDVLLDIFPDALVYEKANHGLDSDLPVSNQYRVVDVKFSTVGLLAAGTVSGRNEYKTQLDVYNRALGRIQGFVPPVGYLAGRAWTQRDDRVDSAIDRIHPVLMFGDAKRGMALGTLTDQAVPWRRRVQLEGQDWNVLPKPSVQELYPNAGNSYDSPWHSAKSEIATRLGELTKISYVGPSHRRDAMSDGITSLDDPSLSAAKLGVTGAKTAPIVDRIIEINRASGSPLVLPKKVRAGESTWRKNDRFEFYVDFETVNNLDDDFSRFPLVGGQPLIFMIGCGHVRNGQWEFRQFTTDRLTTEHEVDVIDRWITHMQEVSEGRESVVYHWSPAEVVSLDTAYKSARERHPENNWRWLEWFDLYKEVFYAEPIGVRGASALGLKAVANAMKSHGLIETDWGSSQVDGMGAMTAAWHYDKQAASDGKTLMDYPLMQEVGEYNHVDCTVMWEILDYLRKHH